jgi:hypothetical protein
MNSNDTTPQNQHGPIPLQVTPAGPVQQHKVGDVVNGHVLTPQMKWVPVGQQPQPKKKRKVKPLHLVAYPATALVCMIWGSALASGASSPVSATPAVTTTVTAPGIPGPEVTVTAPPVTVTAAPPKAVAPPKPKPKPKPVVTIDEGDWVVGEDIPAGTYKVRDAISGSCYWGIYRSGTNHDDIINNDIVTGGRPKVTLRKGQDFTNSGCGIWVKVG